MAKRKVIEDSDDDKDEATPPRRRGAGPGEANSSAPFNPDETLDRNDVAQSVDHSTGSTGPYPNLAIIDSQAEKAIRATESRDSCRT